LRSAKELSELSTELNQMASGLKERMELERALGLATDVQQCLLPETTPRVRGFDVASRSRYCDTTGGDYFDFIDVARLPEGGLMVAVGDVTGHGIASALIMASARAAVRAYAADEPNLGTLMTKVNRVFSADSRHGRFMTLALLAADRPTGPFRWASAGHDATIGYDPVADEFFELEGGDFPLGVVDDNAFEEYRRDSLPAGTILLLGTDGIWETANSAGEAYGKDRLRAAMRTARSGSADDVATAVESDLSAFRGEGNVLDDITMVVIKLAG
jgi:sigma-B regulation protein RsbU (phosphoserine phosphatase)